MWTAMRAALAGKKVAIVHWYKESRRPTNDQKIRDLFPNLSDFLMGQGFYNLPSDHASVDEPLVSSDIIGRSESAIVDLGLTRVIDGRSGEGYGLVR